MGNFFHALKWSAAGEIASKAVQPIVFIVLARLLTPEDYGIVAAAVMVITFTQVFWDSGMGKALIQRQSDFIEAATVAFWVNFTLGAVLCGGLYLAADLIADILFHDHRVSPVLQAMTLQILLGSMSSIPMAILQKEMKFNSLFWVRIISVFVPGLFSIPLAYYGMSYWALVVGTIAGQLMQAVILWSMISWRPSLKFNRDIALELARFGGWVGLTGLLVWGLLWADSFVIGAYLGTHELGLFRTGNTFVILIFDGVLFGPLLPVLYSYLSKSYMDKEKVSASTLKIIKIIATIGIPLCIILFALSEPVANLIFGSKWQGVGYVIGAISIMRGFGWLAGVNGDVYRAIGKPQLETAVLGISFVVFLPVYFIVIRYGFEVFIITRVILGFLTLIPHFLILRSVLSVSITSILRSALTCSMASLLIFAIDFPVNAFITNEFAHIAITGSLSILVVGAIILTLDRKFVFDTFFEFREALSRKRTPN